MGQKNIDYDYVIALNTVYQYLLQMLKTMKRNNTKLDSFREFLCVRNAIVIGLHTHVLVHVSKSLMLALCLHPISLLRLLSPSAGYRCVVSRLIVYFVVIFVAGTYLRLEMMIPTNGRSIKPPFDTLSSSVYGYFLQCSIHWKIANKFIKFLL